MRVVPFVVVAVLALAGCSSPSGGTDSTGGSGSGSSSSTAAAATSSGSSTPSASTTPSSTTSASANATATASASGSSSASGTNAPAGDTTPPQFTETGVTTGTTTVQVLLTVTDASPLTAWLEYGRTGVSPVVCPQDNGTSGQVLDCRRSGNLTGSGTHYVGLDGLEPNREYRAYAIAIDEAGNRATTSFTFSTEAPSSGGGGGGSTSTTTTTAADTSAPSIVNVAFSGVTQTGATVSFTATDASGVASTTVQYGTTSALGSSKPGTSGNGAKTVALTGLSPGTTYHVRVRATDGLGNVAVAPGTGTLTFTTAAAATVTIGSVAVSQLGSDRFTVAWTIAGSSAATSRLEWGTSTSYGSQGAAQSGTGAKSTQAASLSPGTTYFFRVTASDGSATDQATGSQATAVVLAVTINGVSAPSFTHTGPVHPNQPFVASVTNGDSISHDWEVNGQSPAYKTSPLSGGGHETLGALSLPAGTYNVHCNFHAGMTGSFTVS